MIKIISRNQLTLFKKVNLSEAVHVQFAKLTATARNFQSSPSPPSKKKETIEIIRNGIKHLRIFDEIDLAPADLDWEYLLDKKNLDMIIENTKARKGVGNINKVACVVLVFCLL